MLAIALSVALVPQDPGSIAIGPATLRAWCDHLQPVAAESRWREIPWRDSMVAGLRDAAESGRPLLLWMMNGHPLGCT
jgi:hypothetical protein